MADFAYLWTFQEVTGDFVFALTPDSTAFLPVSWGVVPAQVVLDGPSSTGGQVQTKYPGRPYFSKSGSNILPMGNATYQASYSDGVDEFSIHRTGSIVRFYKNFHQSTIPIPMLETTYANNETIRFYAEFSSLVSTAILPDWGFVQHKIPRAYNYTASQQVEDFGSEQSSVKVRVYQESEIVGKGDYVERNL